MSPSLMVQGGKGGGWTMEDHVLPRSEKEMNRIHRCFRLLHRPRRSFLARLGCRLHPLTESSNFLSSSLSSSHLRVSPPRTVPEIRFARRHAHDAGALLSANVVGQSRLTKHRLLMHSTLTLPSRQPLRLIGNYPSSSSRSVAQSKVRPPFLQQPHISKWRQ